MALKDYPMAKPIAYAVSVLTLLGMLLGVGNMFYSNNAWASDVQNAFYELNQSLEEKEKRVLQDKIFEKSFLIQQGSATPLDKALKERYELQLENMNTFGVNNGN